MYELHTLGHGATFLSQVGVSLDVLPQTGVDILLRNAQQHTLAARWDSEPPYLRQGFTPGWRPSAMSGSVDGQGRRESLEGELRIVRSAIRALREAAETAQDQSVTFQLERAEEKEVQLLEALAELDVDSD